MMRGYLRWTGKDGRAEQNRKGVRSHFLLFLFAFRSSIKKKRATDLRRVACQKVGFGEGEVTKINTIADKRVEGVVTKEIERSTGYTCVQF